MTYQGWASWRVEDAEQQEITMDIKNISADVRIVNYGSPFEVEENIVVEWRDPDKGWVRFWATNELSNDFAYTEARATARALASRLSLPATWEIAHRDAIKADRPYL